MSGKICPDCGGETEWGIIYEDGISTEFESCCYNCNPP